MHLHQSCCVYTTDIFFYMCFVYLAYSDLYLVPLVSFLILSSAVRPSLSGIMKSIFYGLFVVKQDQLPTLCLGSSMPGPAGGPRAASPGPVGGLLNGPLSVSEVHRPLHQSSSGPELCADTAGQPWRWMCGKGSQESVRGTCKAQQNQLF